MRPSTALNEHLFRLAAMQRSIQTTPKPGPATWIKPQLAALVKRAPAGSGWLHEIKLDGHRMHARIDPSSVKIITRRGNDWTGHYPAIATALAQLPTKSAYFDGELCAVLPDGRTAFNLVQNAVEHGNASLVYFVFDLLFLDGDDLVNLPLVARASTGSRTTRSTRRRSTKSL